MDSSSGDVQTLFVAMCFDGTESARIRLESLEEHRKYVNEQAEIILSSGPLLEEDGKTRCGQLFILALGSLKEASAFIDADPFTRLGLFDNIIIREFAPIFSNGIRKKTL
jgi:uncharacterized protein YciI